MDSALLGVVIGALVTVGVTFMTHWFTLQQQKAQWQKELEATERKWIRDEQNARVDQLRTAYHESVHLLAVAWSALSDDPRKQVEINDQELSKNCQEAQNWLRLLSLYHLDNHSEVATQFRRALEFFTDNPSYYSSRDLHNKTIELAASDRELAIRAPRSDAPPKKSLWTQISEALLGDETHPQELPEKEPINEKTATLQIDTEFRQQYFLETGEELPESYTFNYDVSRLTREQRKRLWDLHFHVERGMSEKHGFPVPVYVDRSKQIHPMGKPWEARLNPITATPEEVFCAWEDACDQAHGQAKKDQEADAENKD